MSSVKCEMRSVEFKVYSVECVECVGCGVNSVKYGVQSVECKV